MSAITRKDEMRTFMSARETCQCVDRGDLFVEVTQTSGEKVRGKVHLVSGTSISVHCFANGLNEKHFQKVLYQNILIDQISSLVLLDNTYPPKLAKNWDGRFLCVIEFAIQRNHLEVTINETIIGRLDAIYHESIREGCYTPISFEVGVNLDNKWKKMYFEVGNILSMRFLYAPQFLGDKNRIIRQILEPIFPKVLLALVVEYVYFDLYEKLPQAWDKFLLREY